MTEGSGNIWYLATAVKSTLMLFDGENICKKLWQVYHPPHWPPSLINSPVGFFQKTIHASYVVGFGVCYGSTDFMSETSKLPLPKNVYGCNCKHMFTEIKTHASYCPTGKVVLVESTTAFIYLRKSNRRISHQLSYNILCLITIWNILYSTLESYKLKKKTYSSHYQCNSQSIMAWFCLPYKWLGATPFHIFSNNPSREYLNSTHQKPRLTQWLLLYSSTGIPVLDFQYLPQIFKNFSSHFI